MASRQRRSTELPLELSEIIDKLIKHASSFIKDFDNSEHEMREIVGEIQKIAVEVEQMQKETDAVRTTAVFPGGVGLGLMILAALFTGGLGLLAGAAARGPAEAAAVVGVAASTAVAAVAVAVRAALEGAGAASVGAGTAAVRAPAGAAEAEGAAVGAAAIAAAAVGAGAAMAAAAVGAGAAAAVGAGAAAAVGAGAAAAVGAGAAMAATAVAAGAVRAAAGAVRAEARAVIPEAGAVRPEAAAGAVRAAAGAVIPEAGAVRPEAAAGAVRAEARAVRAQEAAAAAAVGAVAAAAAGIGAAVAAGAVGAAVAAAVGAGAVAAATGGAVAASVNTSNIKIQIKSAKEIEKLGKEFLWIAEPLKIDLGKILTMCEQLEEESAKVQAENALSDMKEFQRILRRVNELAELSKDVLHVGTVLFNNLLMVFMIIFRLTATPKEDGKFRYSIIQSAHQSRKVFVEFYKIKMTLRRYFLIPDTGIPLK